MQRLCESTRDSHRDGQIIVVCVLGPGARVTVVVAVVMVCSAQCGGKVGHPRTPLSVVDAHQEASRVGVGASAQDDEARDVSREVSHVHCGDVPASGASPGGRPQRGVASDGVQRDGLVEWRPSAARRAVRGATGHHV